MTGRPYAHAADHYQRIGWQGPLPVGLEVVEGVSHWREREKSSPPAGYTGRSGGWPDQGTIRRWVGRVDVGACNIALRVPDGIIGIDVDEYGTKQGLQNLLTFQNEHDLPGLPLARTIRSTSRGAGQASGIYWFRTPTELRWTSDPCDDVEIVQHGHRYALVWPSVHPSGATYEWYRTVRRNDEVVVTQIDPPSLDDARILQLPDEWVDVLTCPEETPADHPPAQEHREDDWSDDVTRVHKLFVDRLGTASDHETARGLVMALCRLEQQDHPGATAAIDSAGGYFIAAVTDPSRNGEVRSAYEARSEWQRLLSGGRQRAQTTEAPADDDSWIGDDTPPDVGKKGPGTSATDSGARKVRLTPLSTIKPRPVRWTWDDRVPVGEVTLTPGRGGIGKSTFHAWVIAKLTIGTLPGVHHGTPKACIIAAAEDSYERTIVPRLIAAGADMERVYRADVVTVEGVELFLSLPADCDGLETEVTRIGAALVSIDPLMSVIHGSLDTHKDREVRTAIEPLSRLADRTGVAILGNAHFNKSTGNDPLSLIMGSAAFGNVVRAAIGFARDPEADDGACVLSQVKNNLGRLDLPSLRYVIQGSLVDTEEGPASVGKFAIDGESDRSVADILGDRDSDDDRSALSEAADWLRSVLSDGPTPKRDVATAAKAEGITRPTLDRAAKRIGVVSERDDSQKGRPSTWSLPDYVSSDNDPDNLRHNPESSDQGKQSPGFDYASDSDGETKPNICTVCGGPPDHPTTTHTPRP